MGARGTPCVYSVYMCIRLPSWRPPFASVYSVLGSHSIPLLQDDMYLLYQEGFVLDAMARCFGIQLLAVNISLFFFSQRARPPLHYDFNNGQKSKSTTATGWCNYLVVCGPAQDPFRFNGDDRELVRK